MSHWGQRSAECCMTNWWQWRRRIYVSRTRQHQWLLKQWLQLPFDCDSTAVRIILHVVAVTQNISSS